jgi:serine phosphatase RsbU (regulator of sigma subunit)/anti-sigma regulatory factor (Ser/Thr protein kinase)/ABC-type transporter Mla MlaB component
VLDDGAGPLWRAGEPDTVVSVFEDTPIMLVSMEGPDHRFVAANRAYREFLAVPDIVGMLVREVAPDMESQGVIPLMDRVYASGKAEGGLEWRLVTPGRGEWFADFTIAPRHDAAGEVIGLFGYVVDTTTQVKARQAAQARADRAQERLEQARDLIVTLQQELLPAGVPVLPGLDLAASYLLADADTAAGGDWFDTLPLPDGRVALVVGDVVGHGMAASATMGQLRVMLADRLEQGGNITDALQGLDRTAGRVRGADAATVCVTVFDPASGDLEYCTAGHPPPLIVTAHGQTRYLAPSGAGPLGSGAGFAVARDRLDLGDLVLLYTDGIIERPGRDLAGSTVELARAAQTAAAGTVLPGGPSASERVSTQTVELLVRATGHADDLTLLAARRTQPVADLRVQAVAAPEFLADLRVELGRWLRDHGVGEPDVLALQHTVGELVTNAMEHGYAGASGMVEVRGTVTADGRVVLSVSDQGRWREPVAPQGDGDRGVGLAMSSDLVDRLDVRHDAGGTTAHVEHRPTRPARLLTDDSADLGTPHARVPDADPFLILPTPSGLRVDGPVDAASAPTLERELRKATHGGVTSVELDLTGVTHLASAGVAVLAAARRRAADGATVALIAPPGTPADQILTLVRVPHGRDRTPGPTDA